MSPRNRKYGHWPMSPLYGREIYPSIRIPYALRWKTGRSLITGSISGSRTRLWCRHFTSFPRCRYIRRMILRDIKPGIAGKADLEGKKVSVQTGTTADAGCTDAGYDVQAFAANADAKAALTTGKVDAWVVDNLTAVQMVEEGDGLVILEEYMTEEPYAFAFAFGSEDLVAEIDKILTKLVDDGTIEAIFAEYGETYFKP